MKMMKNSQNFTLIDPLTGDRIRGTVGTISINGMACLRCYVPYKTRLGKTFTEIGHINMDDFPFEFNTEDNKIFFIQIHGLANAPIRKIPHVILDVLIKKPISNIEYLVKVNDAKVKI